MEHFAAWALKKRTICQTQDYCESWKLLSSVHFSPKYLRTVTMELLKVHMASVMRVLDGRTARDN